VASWVALAVPLLIVVAGAWSYRWVQEDAFIDFRIIGNLLAGHGPVFNVGERVEAYSDPLWLFLLAGVHELLPFLSLEWMSVVLGLVGTAVGVVLAGRAFQRLVEGREGDTALPVGLVIFAVVAGVWEFATSGLEMGLAFCWIGLCFWLLVRTEAHRDSALWCASVMGLGTLIRPELILMSVVELAALAVVVGAPGWRGPTSVMRRYVAPTAAAVALPALYELWRMAYFALVVSNTALAKSATASWWDQGFTYVWNFTAPYTLWLPLALAVPLVLPRLARWWRRGDRTGVVVLVTPLAAALVDILYVARVGGDYQHARLLLPGFMTLCLPIVVGVRQLRTVMVVPVIGIVVWSVVCAGWLRYSTGGLFLSDHGITDERSVWVAVSRSPHPVNAAEYHNHLGSHYATLGVAERRDGRQAMLVDSSLSSSTPGRSPDIQPARSALPFGLVVNAGAIGVTGYLSGPDVYIFDDYSLANPVGSHFTVAQHGRPGHQKFIGPDWMVARFGATVTQAPEGVGGPSVTAARRALGCGTLHAYLRAITAPWGVSRALSDITHSVTFTTMAFSSQPRVAEQQLCR
jgi:arabinofuranosyltransferase